MVIKMIIYGDNLFLNEIENHIKNGNTIATFSKCLKELIKRKFQTNNVIIIIDKFNYYPEKLSEPFLSFNTKIDNELCVGNFYDEVFVEF